MQAYVVLSRRQVTSWTGSCQISIYWLFCALNMCVEQGDFEDEVAGSLATLTDCFARLTGRLWRWSFRQLSNLSLSDPEQPVQQPPLSPGSWWRVCFKFNLILCINIRIFGSNYRKLANMVLNVHRNHKACTGWEEGGMEMGEEGGRLYICHYTGTTIMTPALRWTKMRAISMFH